MLSDELDSKPEVIFITFILFYFLTVPALTPTLFSFCSSSQLLVQFVQNASIPLVQGLEDSDSKHSCLPLLAPTESSLCSPLELTGQLLTSTNKTKQQNYRCCASAWYTLSRDFVVLGQILLLCFQSCHYQVHLSHGSLTSVVSTVLGLCDVVDHHDAVTDKIFFNTVLSWCQILE